ncbi:MAG: Wadjet anti-phage system protein JetD domain-containing protein, partial [Pseudomonadales bacterium]
DRLLTVHGWICAHPKPGIYLRQIDLPGVDTKFIEAHRDVLTEWCDLTLAAGVANESYRGVRGFARRYGFLDKPTRLRLRSLDPTMALVQPAVSGNHSLDDAVASATAAETATRAGTGAAGGAETSARFGVEAGALAMADVTLNIQHAARLNPQHRNVVITENEVNFLALPNLPGSVAIFGAGYGWQALADLRWLQSKHVYYWGDIDTHGFAILNELRHYLPDAKSIMMDTATLLAHRDQWGSETSPERRDLLRLTADESVLLADLLNDRYGRRLRLEQERISFGYAQEALTNHLSVG